MFDGIETFSSAIAATYDEFVPYGTSAHAAPSILHLRQGNALFDIDFGFGERKERKSRSVRAKEEIKRI